MKNEKKTGLKCQRCKKQTYFRGEDVALNEYDQRVICCSNCGNEIVLKRK